MFLAAILVVAILMSQKLSHVRSLRDVLVTLLACRNTDCQTAHLSVSLSSML